MTCGDGDGAAGGPDMSTATSLSSATMTAEGAAAATGGGGCRRAEQKIEGQLHYWRRSWTRYACLDWDSQRKDGGLAVELGEAVVRLVLRNTGRRGVCGAGRAHVHSASRRTRTGKGNGR